MRLEVLSREDMNELSRKLSRAGIMNRPVEETKPEIEHYLIVRGKYSKLVELSPKAPILGEELEAIQLAYEELMRDWEVGQEKPLSELFEEPDLSKLSLITALIEEGAVEERDGVLVLRGKPPLDNLELELRFPIDGLEEELDELDDLNATLITEYTLSKHYYVEVLEVDRELLENALEIAEEYATEESLVEATFDAIARSVLAEKILELAEKHRRKNELIEALMEIEPITVEAEGDRVNIYYDEDAIEDFLKTLQTLGYLKVKGNRIWV
ncbi:hypothetical protein, conserved [Thermococcus kodakarensis KOD1]|uniref:Uncharacterized protein n=1 Tax=Thermococcus kodakarensis (strain ATCC BAA-918 / JCM 12380 / KOD1) TaxID=69014 RepID=Q5JFH2_THEKO|nr:hypothetical protein [Thermococcus kodakarensis]WCN29140.1 hypothetical protein POG15_00750 [Thermococcus kodakarensis]WCN31446.1 hypothetical protein POG21_00750 [Thermococcus kodakarensis]BAD84333.1 hypothetical protein, conserved [Thermococcus kodakarensis KOD1]